MSTYITKCTPEFVQDLVELVAGSPLLITGIDVQTRPGEKNLVIHFTDVETEKDQQLTIKLEKE